MQIYVVFGLPGAGKTFVGKIFEKHFDFYFHDGDKDLPDEMIHAIRNQNIIKKDMRDIFFKRIIKSCESLRLKFDKIVISQTFIKEIYRKQFLSQFPNAKFVLAQADTAIRENRLLKRKDYPLNLDYARKMCKNFDTPLISYEVIDNNIEGEEYIIKQLQKLLYGCG
ncbi:MAG: hypothetical protein M1365_04170 [Actinobacteria bacterium]|nr:hypothetical protein [Actinomycetota bacterium]